MIKEYHQHKVNSNFLLVINESDFGKARSTAGKDKFYTFAWNNGPKQKVMLDELTYDFPANAVLPIMMSQHFRFEKPQQIVAWQFNREFYCVVNHDAEVGCVGFLFYGVSASMFILPDAESLNELKLLLNNFQKEFESDEWNKDSMLRTLLVRFIIILTRQARKQYLNVDFKEDRFSLLRQFNLLVEINYKKQHGVQFYADKLFKSPKTISNIFAQFSDKSPQQIIHERIVSEAKRLLYYSDKSMKEIAKYLGFDDPAHFSKFFKNQTGENPTEVRKKWQKGK
ncbi:MAG: helix-turn-helix domain-containing protein [Cyclobacteriaceae bacterium]|jgi:AraC-like DNA-binding protein|nr:helix-turn-helix domain-containing protein [Cyclobacteriaceae bacterium]